MLGHVKKMWVDALRSGAYTQGRHQLKTYDGYCCLGVLCDLHSKQTSRGKWDDNKYDTSEDSSTNVLPGSVACWAGLETFNPKINEKTLSAYNDTGKSFNEIADLIEANL